jgi:MFS transporter, ACS family, solute carrier family 17 (sodium-dependent inorganic phosphate cotransporter), other
VHERATAVGISMAGFHLGNVISFLATPIIMSYIGINGTFAFFASLGYAWLCMWLLFISNEPHDSPHISEAELQLIQAGRSESKSKTNKFPSLRLLLSKIQMWAIIVANIVNNWVYLLTISLIRFVQVFFTILFLICICIYLMFFFLNYVMFVCTLV